MQGVVGSREIYLFDAMRLRTLCVNFGGFLYQTNISFEL